MMRENIFINLMQLKIKFFKFDSDKRQLDCGKKNK